MNSHTLQTQRSGISDSSVSVDELSHVTSMFVRKRRRGLKLVDNDGSPSFTCLELVFGYLRPKDLARAACVCRSWQKAANNDNLWEAICKRRWPSTRNPNMLEIVRQGGGFRHFFRRRIIGPEKPQIPSFEMDDITFFLDVHLHSHPIISHAFKYSGGCSLVYFTPESFIDEKAIFPPIHAYDFEDFRKLFDVNLCAIRVSDSKGVCLLKSSPGRCGPGLIDIDSGESVKSLKINFNTALGGHLGQVYYGMLNVGFSFPVEVRKLAAGDQICFGALSVERKYSEGSKLSRLGGMVMEISALKDRLGGTVKIQIAGDEFRMLLSSLNWD